MLLFCFSLVYCNGPSHEKNRFTSWITQKVCLWAICVIGRSAAKQNTLKRITSQSAQVLINSDLPFVSKEGVIITCQLDMERLSICNLNIFLSSEVFELSY